VLENIGKIAGMKFVAIVHNRTCLIGCARQA
jgi:hypothetical protein